MCESFCMLHCTAQTQSHLSHLLDAVGKDVSNDDPLLRRWPEVHLHQHDVVEQHQVSNVGQLRRVNTESVHSHRDNLLPISLSKDTLRCFELYTVEELNWYLETE